MNFFGAAAIAALLAPAGAVAGTTFLYALSSDGGYYDTPGGSLTGSITLYGNIGDTVPELVDAGVISFQFTVDGGASYNNSDSTFPTDNLTFSGTLGATTLTGTSGLWQIATAGDNSDLYLWGQPNNAQFGEIWGWCVPPNGNDDCGDLANTTPSQFWALTLVSETSDTPEPATAGLVLSALAALFVGRLRRKSSAA